MNKALYYFVLAVGIINFGEVYGYTWTRTIGGPEDDCGYSICLSQDSGYVLAGYTESFGAGMGDVQLIKTDSGGDLHWDNTFGGSGMSSDYGYCIRETMDGGYIIAGATKSYGQNHSFDLWLIRTDPGPGIEESAKSKVETDDYTVTKQFTVLK